MLGSGRIGYISTGLVTSTSIVDISQVPDNGDLGGFLHEKPLFDKTLKLFMKRSVKN